MDSLLAMLYSGPSVLLEPDIFRGGGDTKSWRVSPTLQPLLEVAFLGSGSSCVLMWQLCDVA